MATARSLTGINWMVRIYGPTLLTTCGRAADATQLSSLALVNSTARINSAITRLNTLELNLKGQYGAAWDEHWSTALEFVKGQVIVQCPIPLDEMMVDPDVTVKTAAKTVLRALELAACQFVVDGGVLI